MAPLRPKFYFLAPSTDSPVDGPIFLGGIVTHPRNADCPLNSVPLPVNPDVNPIYSDTIDNYSVTFEKDRSNTLGIWLSFLMQILGIGGDVTGSLESSDSEKWHVKTLKTTWFNPSPQYIKDSLEHSAVKDHLAKDANWLRSSKLYMITGLKVAYGASAALSTAKSKGINLHAGVDFTSLGVPIQAGPDIGTSQENKVVQAMGDKTPFVIAFRMQRIQVTSSGAVKDNPVTGGMLGHEDNPAQSERAGSRTPDFSVSGIEENDTNADEFEIDGQWGVADCTRTSAELCQCSLVRDIE